MGELRRGARLPQEAVPRGRLAGPLGRQQLDRHAAVEAKLAGQVNNSHATAPQTALQHVPPGQRAPEFGGNCVRRHGA